MAVSLPPSGEADEGRYQPLAEINVTPMVDVMLVLLIIFMVTAPLLVAGVPVDLPESRANALPEESDQVTVSIDQAGQVYLDSTRVAQGKLPETLETLGCGRTRDSGAKPPLITLRADRALDYGRVMAVMGELNRAGCNSVSLVTGGSSRAP